MARTRLLNPGPVSLTPRVRRGLLGPDLCHREPEFTELQSDVRTRLLNVYPAAASEFTSILLAGSGTAAVEAMVASLVPRDGLALVVANGIYGDRLAAILSAQGKRFEAVRSDWTAPLDAGRVAWRLGLAPRITHVLAVHHETTTGRLNDVATLGELCRAHDAGLLLDCVSSFGAEAIDFQTWNLSACASTSNKCLHGAPGTAFVIARRRLLTSTASGCPGLYLDLHRHYAEQEAGRPLFTPAVPSIYALREALIELEEQGGREGRRAAYLALSRTLRQGMAATGFPLLLGDPDEYASMLSSFVLPPAVRFELLHDALKRRGFVVYPGQQYLRDRMFRIAVMGDLGPGDIEELLERINAFVGASAREVACS